MRYVYDGMFGLRDLDLVAPTAAPPAPTTEQLVAAEIEKQKAAAEAELAAQAAAYQAQITEQTNAVNAKARDLDNEYHGFMTGVRPPAYMTEVAGVTVRDSFFGMPNVVPTAHEQKSEINFGLILGLGFIAYLFLGKRR